MEQKTFYWYNAVVQFIVEDENSGRVKKVKENYLVKGVSVTDAELQIENDLDASNLDYRILSVTESKIIRIIKPEKLDLNA